MSATNVGVGDTIKVDCLIPDGGAGLFPQAILRDASNTPIAGSPLDLASVSGDLYSGTFVMPNTTKVTALVTIYTDAGHTIPSTVYEPFIDEYIKQAVSVVDNAAIADAVWDEALSGHSATGSTGKALSDAAAGGGVSAADIADAVWDEAKSGHDAAGSFGHELNSNQAEHDATQSAISSLALSSNPSGFDLEGEVEDIGELEGELNDC